MSININKSKKKFEKYLKLTISLVFLLGFIVQNSTMACTLTMGYRTNERLPLIKKQPDNSGLYHQLYSIAAKKLGCELKVQRGSKKRIVKMLKKGRIDFYPGFNFTEKRAKFSYYIENGLPGGDIGISHQDLPPITSLNQLTGLTLLAALGAPDFTKGIEGIKTHEIREMTVDKAITLLRLKRGDFYIYNKSTLEYYLTENKIKDIKTHPDCCGGVTPLYLAFSRKSAHYNEVSNPKFNHSNPISVENFPVLVSQNSLAYQLQKNLKGMKDSGETNELYQQYYTNRD